jgi:hypothetical protein
VTGDGVDAALDVAEGVPNHDRLPAVDPRTVEDDRDPVGIGLRLAHSGLRTHAAPAPLPICSADARGYFTSGLGSMKSRMRFTRSCHEVVNARSVRTVAPNLSNSSTDIPSGS